MTMLTNPIYTISTHNVYVQEKGRIDGIAYNGEKMDAIFCENEKGIYVIICKYRKTDAFKCGGHWHSGKRFYDVYYRKNFKSRDEGNEYFKAVKKNMVIC